MEFVLELIFEIVIEGCLEVWSEKKVPMPIRILCAFVFMAIYLGFSGALIYIGYDAMVGGNWGAAILFYVVGFGLLIGVFYILTKKFKEKHKEKEEQENETKISEGQTTE